MFQTQYVLTYTSNSIFKFVLLKLMESLSPQSAAILPLAFPSAIRSCQLPAYIDSEYFVIFLFFSICYCQYRPLEL